MSVCRLVNVLPEGSVPNVLPEHAAKKKNQVSTSAKLHEQPNILLISVTKIVHTMTIDFISSVTCAYYVLPMTSTVRRPEMPTKFHKTALYIVYRGVYKIVDQRANGEQNIWKLYCNVKRMPLWRNHQYKSGPCSFKQLKYLTHSLKPKISIRFFTSHSIYL